MAINRIEIAIDCDDPMGEGIEILADIAQMLGLDVESDVEVIVTSSDDGEPLLVAVLTHDEGNDDDHA